MFLPSSFLLLLSPPSSFLTSILSIMAKTTKSKAVKSPKKSRTESSTTESKRTGCVQKKATTHEAQQLEAGEDELGEPTTDTLTLKIPAHVVWDKYPECMECLLDYLDTHPNVTIKLFGDSTQTAKLEGHSKLTAKSNKAAMYCTCKLPMVSFLSIIMQESKPILQATQTSMRRLLTTTSPTRKYLQ